MVRWWYQRFTAPWEATDQIPPKYHIRAGRKIALSGRLSKIRPQPFLLFVDFDNSSVIVPNICGNNFDCERDGIHNICSRMRLYKPADFI